MDGGRHLVMISAGRDAFGRQLAKRLAGEAPRVPVYHASTAQQSCGIGGGGDVVGGGSDGVEGSFPQADLGADDDLVRSRDLKEGRFEDGRMGICLAGVWENAMHQPGAEWRPFPSVRCVDVVSACSFGWEFVRRVPVVRLYTSRAGQRCYENGGRGWRPRLWRFCELIVR